jgi:hypothetical protein
MRCMALTGRARHPSGGTPMYQFLKSYDPEAHDGMGFAEWTTELDQAMKFDTAGEAWMLWRTIPTSRPRRPDGQFNRPLTAFTIEVMDV